MLRSLYDGISGLAAHQKMLDVTGNNIANVNTVGFKSSSVTFEDTLSQTIGDGGAASVDIGGTNPAQIGLGVKVAGIDTNFGQGSAQATGKPTDLMISGDGFFVVRSGTQQLFTRAGSFDFDDQGNLVDPSGNYVQGWIGQNGEINTAGQITDVKIPLKSISPSQATTAATLTGNLPDDAATGTTLVRDLDVYDASGNKSTLQINLTRTATGWDVGDGTTTFGSLTYANGAITGPSTITAGAITLDFGATTGYAKLSTVGVSSQDGRAVGTLDSYSISPDGTISGSFSNGTVQKLAQISLASFVNPAGLLKAGDNTYSASTAAGLPTFGAAGSGGLGKLDGGYLEMSNVDLSREFTNLIVAQRGFQANARIITTSDQVLEELVSLKR